MKRFFVVGFILLMGQMSIAETVNGQVFEKGSSRQKLLFQFKNVITDDGATQKADAQFNTEAGDIVVRETSERQGTSLKRYDVDHRQTARKGSIVVEGDKITFNFEENGKAKSPETEKLPANFVVGHTLAPYVASHWKELSGGQSIDIRFGVWDRQETVGFTLSKVGQEKLNGKDAVILKFKPTSFVIAALVDPVLFKFSTDGKELLGMVGRVAPKRKDGNKWRDLDAEVIYSTSP